MNSGISLRTHLAIYLQPSAHTIIQELLKTLDSHFADNAIYTVLLCTVRADVVSSVYQRLLHLRYARTRRYINAGKHGVNLIHHVFGLSHHLLEHGRDVIQR